MNKDIVIFLEKVEEYLLKTNIHTDIVSSMMNFLVKKTLTRTNISKQDIILLLHNQIKYLINLHVKTLSIDEDIIPYVMIVCGVNGSGKTTTIGKMTNLLHSLGWSVVVGACDTFRDGAKEQLHIWVNNFADDFICKEFENETTTKVAVKAYNVAQSKGRDVLIIDTAGRLQNDQDLMAELLKMKQKLHDLSPYAPNDVVLIVDANCGYNAFEQATIYNDLIGISGIIATKMDIAKKPGVILSICSMFKIPIYGITDGEDRNDIKDLDPDMFADAILSDIDELS